MEKAEPQVFIISEPSLRWGEVVGYLESVGGEVWARDRRADLEHRYPEGASSAETLVEFMGKICYRSWVPGLNPNVKKVREDQKGYIENILRSKHGSVLEHAYFSFIFCGVSRIFTHELVRHRAGVAISQESMRFVRLDDIPFWMPEWARGDEELAANATFLLEQMELFQGWMAEHFELDGDRPCPDCGGSGDVAKNKDVEGPSAFKELVYIPCLFCKATGRVPVDFHEKKAKTSFMRRFAPDGVATSIGWTANVRTLRHVIEARTNEGAEEEIRMVFDKVATRMKAEYPYFFGDFVKNNLGEWIPELGSKV